VKKVSYLITKIGISGKKKLLFKEIILETKISGPQVDAIILKKL